MYILSSGEAMSKFMKNPRPYLLPPQPRPPVKLCVMGPPHSGKTTLCHNLAEKYGAQVKLSHSINIYPVNSVQSICR